MNERRKINEQKIELTNEKEERKWKKTKERTSDQTKERMKGWNSNKTEYDLADWELN